MNLPNCHMAHDGKVVIAVKQTSSTIYAIECVEMQHEVTSYRIVEFHKNFKSIEYDVAKCAQKMLDRQNRGFSFTSTAISELKEIVMNNSKIIAVNPAAEFIGRFASIEALSVACPSDTVVIQSADDFEQFTKPQLLECLSVKPEKNIKNVTKTELAEALYDEYMTKTVTVIEPKSSESRGKKGGNGLMYAVYNALADGPMIVESFINDYNTSMKCFQSALSYIKNPKYCGQLIPMGPTVKGTYNGQMAIIKEELLEQFPTFERRSKMSEEKGEKVERNGIRKQLREFFEEGGSATKAELAEKFGVAMKIISDNICYLKNPKFAGAKGPLNLVTDKETKVVSIAA